MAVLLSSLGIHRFYLGKPVSSALHLLFSWSGAPSMVATVAVLFMSQDAWTRKYNLGVLSAPIPLLIRILALIIAFMLIAGLFSQVAMPVVEICRSALCGNWI